MVRGSGTAVTCAGGRRVPGVACGEGLRYHSTHNLLLSHAQKFFLFFVCLVVFNHFLFFLII